MILSLTKDFHVLRCWFQLLKEPSSFVAAVVSNVLPVLAMTQAISIPEYDSDNKPFQETVKPMVDGGTEGLEGYARVIMPRITPCFERNIWISSPYIKFPLCTFAKTQSTAAHCIEYARFIKWDKNICSGFIQR
ncbi:NEDD8-activating enzyme E1 catalytic subunit-like isoform X3 [Lolium perenne]|nr:NEDD8-activating enzyme E1 catalytic subunit-like [Lolium perenne]